MSHSINVSFSIIIACYNEITTIRECLESVFNQTYKDFEVIVIDGGSIDGTTDIIKSFSNQISYWQSKEDNGISDAWNQALIHASGDWIYFLGADDSFISPSVLSQTASAIKFNNLYHYDLICGSIQLMNNSKKIQPNIHKFPLEMLPHQGLFHARSLFYENHFSTQYKIRGDYELLIRIWKQKTIKIFSIEKITVALYAGGLSMSPCYRLAIFWETIRLFKHYELPVFSFKMLIFFFKAIVKQAICVGYILKKRE